MDAYADGTPLPDNNTASWYSFAQRPYDQGGLGLAPHQAAGVVGNLMQESGSGIPSWGPTGDNGTAWGAAQWRNDRLSGLKDFAKANGMDPKSTEAQQAWMRQELSTTHAGAYDALKNASSPEGAANAFNKLYEISADTSGQRAANARALFQGGPAAIAQAAGIPKSAGTGALALSGDDDEEDSDSTGNTGSLAQPPGALSPGGVKLVMKGDKPNKLAAFGQMLTSVAAGLASGVNPAQAQALLAQAKMMNDQSQSKYKTFMGRDGTIYRQDDSGNITSVPGGTAAPKLQYKEMTGPNGAKIPGNYNSATGQWTPIQNPQQQGQQANLDQNGLPESFDDLQKMNPSLANQVAQINSGAVKLPTSSFRNPQNTMLRNAVFKYFPDTDENTFNARNQFAKNFGTDQPSQPGGQSVGLGHSMDILDQLGKNYVQQNNFGPMLGAGTTLNSIKNAQVFGGQNATTANNGGDLAYKLSTETGRLYSGNQGGGVHERADTLRRFGGDSQELTPVQQAGILREQRDVLTSRQEELEGQRDKLFGNDPTAAKRYSFRDAKTQKALEGINATLAHLDPNGPEARILAGQQAGQSAQPTQPTQPDYSGWGFKQVK